MTAMPPFDPMLGPTTRLMWRSDHTVQLELGSRAVVVDGIAPEAVRRLVANRRAAADPVPRAGESLPPTLAPLAEAGFLWGRTDDEDDLRLAPPVPRLAGELASLTARHGERAAEVLNARRHCTVAVHGDGRAGPQVAALLAAAGVGRVHVVGSGDARLHHATPGGITVREEGTSFVAAADSAIHRAAPDADTTPLPMGERPDLVVLAVDDPVDVDRRDALHARDCAHLAVRLGADFGVVGPLVIPGLTSCLRCADLHRLDRDPAWNAIAVQLAVPRRHAAASDVCLTTVVAGIAAMQASSYLDGDPVACIDGTVELHRPDWQPRRRSWPAHPECDCGR